MATRARVLAGADVEPTALLPAWRRYTGTFYQHAGQTLTSAVAAGHVVIVSGGYGVVRADEPIGWYDKILRLSDWPAGVLESALLGEARSIRATTMVGFAASTTDYARLLRRVPWHRVGRAARA